MVAIFKGTYVAVKEIRRRPVELSREVLLELKQVFSSSISLFGFTLVLLGTGSNVGAAATCEVDTKQPFLRIQSQGSPGRQSFSKQKGTIQGGRIQMVAVVAAATVRFLYYTLHTLRRKR